MGRAELGDTPLRAHLAGLAILVTAYLTIFAIGFDWSSRGFFHRHFDQVSYRYEAAKVTEGLQEDLWVGLVAAWNQTTAQGVAYPLVGGIAYHLGIDPAHAMFVLFLALLATSWFALSSFGRQPWLGWLGIAAFASTTTLLNKTGGPVDFRPDFLGQAFWTAATALALCSATFANRRASIGLGILFGLAFCSRSFLLAYAAAALPLCFIAAWVGLPDQSKQRRDRLINLALVVVIACAIAAPLFVHNFERLWDYYVDNHLSAKENEARGYNRTFADNLPNYIRSLRRNHVGWAAAFVMALGFCMTLRGGAKTLVRRWPLLLVWLAFLTPIAVMAAGPQFSATVSGVVAGSAAFLPVVPAVGRLELRPPRRLLVAAVLLGLAVWPIRFLYKCGKDHNERRAAGHHLVAQQHRAILDRTEGRSGVLLSTLPLIEAHSLSMLELVGFEQTGRLPRRFADGLGHQIYRRDSADDFEQALRASEVVLWWDGGASGGDLPANREAIERRDLIRRVLAEDFAIAGDAAGEIRLEGHPLRLYFRR